MKYYTLDGKGNQISLPESEVITYLSFHLPVFIEYNGKQFRIEVSW